MAVNGTAFQSQIGSVTDVLPAACLQRTGWIPSNLQSLQRITDYAVTEYICSAGIGN